MKNIAGPLRVRIGKMPVAFCAAFVAQLTATAQEVPDVRSIAAAVPSGASIGIIQALTAGKSHAPETELGIAMASFSHKLDEGYFLSGSTGIVRGDINGEIANIGVGKRLDKNSSVIVSYLGFYQEGSERRPKPQDDRAVIEFHSNYMFDQIRVHHRTRLEHRFRDVADQTRLRPRLEVGFLSSSSVSPFLAIEPIVDITEGEFQVLVSEAGVVTRLTDRVNLRLTYVRGDFANGTELRAGLLALSVRL